MIVVFDKVFIDYIKWDMNCNLMEVYLLYSDLIYEGEISYCFILGVYDLMECLIKCYL